MDNPYGITVDVKNMTGRERSAYVLYKNSTMESLADAYGRYSERKRKAWDGCKALCYQCNGHGLKVIGANTSFFSAGFEFEQDGRECFMFITKSENTAVYID